MVAVAAGESVSRKVQAPIVVITLLSFPLHWPAPLPTSRPATPHPPALMPLHARGGPPLAPGDLALDGAAVAQQRTAVQGRAFQDPARGCRAHAPSRCRPRSSCGRLRAASAAPTRPRLICWLCLSEAGWGSRPPQRAPSKEDAHERNGEDSPARHRKALSVHRVRAIAGVSCMAHRPLPAQPPRRCVAGGSSGASAGASACAGSCPALVARPLGKPILRL